MSILIKNGRLIDPANKLDEISDLFVEGERITRIEKELKLEALETIDAAGKIVMPGIVDLHVHLREPGREDKETIASGTAAALHGGVTSLLAMPNTLSTIDCIENVRLLKDIISRTALANVYMACAITKGRAGAELTDIETLKKEGAVAISDDGSSVDAPALMLEALKRAKKAKMLVTCHCEDKALSAQGVMNLGFVSTCLGLRGMPKESEYRRIERDIELASSVDAPIHIAHVSCRESLKIIAEAKKRGVKVTCETAPHYFTFTEEAVRGYDTNFKMNPPLRTSDDVLAVREGLHSGIIDAIASDHAPHTENEKEIEFDRAEFGIIGLETELALSITELVAKSIIDFPSLVAKLTCNPAKILGIPKGTLGIGQDADIVVLSPDKDWLVKKEHFFSKSKNSPYIGRILKGVVEYTIVAGKIAYTNANSR